MHTVEHVGLGRYGDEIDPDGDLKAMSELNRVLAINGNLLFAVPIGCKPRLQYNAHRIYTYDTIIEAFSNMELVNFAFIRSGAANENTFMCVAERENIGEEKYGCGCFWFNKKTNQQF
jgi:hypothetical protein